MRIRFVLHVCVRFFSREWKPGARHKQLRNAVFGIALSIIPLILVQEVANGMIEGITRRYLEIGSFHFQIRSFDKIGKEEMEEITHSLEKIPGITHIIPVKQGIGLVYNKTLQRGVTIRGIPVDLYERDEEFRKYFEITEGDFSLKGGNDLLVSREIADALGAKLNDQVQIITAMSIPGRPPILKPSVYRVSGIFTTGYFELDSLSLYVSLPQGWKIFSDPGTLFFGVKTEDPYDTKQMEEITKDMEERLPEGWYSYSWTQLEGNMYSSLKMTKRILLFIMAMIIVVASVTISSSLIMLVMEKQEEIAILKSIGAKPGEVTAVFFIAGGICGVAGSIIGTLAGLLLSVNINGVISVLERIINFFLWFYSYGFASISGKIPDKFTLLDPDFYLTIIPIRLYWIEIALSMGFAILLSLLAASVPALKAGGVKPLDILRRH